MTPCRDIVKILSRGDDLPFLKRMELKMHLAMCDHCSKYFKHLQIMKGSFDRLFKKKTSAHLSEVERLKKETVNKITGRPSTG